MAQKKKQTKPKRPAPKAEEAIPGDVAHGRARDAAETQAVGMDNLALALDVLGCGVSRLAAALVEEPMGESSKLERLVLAAEKQADARLRIAATLEASNLRQQAIHEVELAERKAKADLVTALAASEKARALGLREAAPITPAPVVVGDAPPSMVVTCSAPEVPLAAAPYPSQTYEGGTATPIVAVSTPAEPASPQA